MAVFSGLITRYPLMVMVRVMMAGYSFSCQAGMSTALCKDREVLRDDQMLSPLIKQAHFLVTESRDVERVSAFSTPPDFKASTSSAISI